jgi:L-asparagine transporter-like permease
MIAIGGAIGVGLFLGSSVTIQLAGPGVILSYLGGAAIAIVVAYALAEMAVVQPVAGSFGVYAETYLSTWAGFSVRVTYAIVQIIAIGAEVTAVAIYFAFWFPNVPGWTWVITVSIGLVLVNGLQVGNFGEFEYWFAMIKVISIIVFIVAGISLILGLGSRPALGLRNLTHYGGFLPHGWKGVWLALTLAITSYIGIEVVAVAAGEAKEPETAIPRAMRTISFRLIVFYVLAMSVMLAMTPWNETGSSAIGGSPFVQTFQAVGIPFAATIMNIVVITAALSSANTNLYLSTRMLFSLSLSGHAPEWLGLLSSEGVPHRALASSAVGMIGAIVLAIFAPQNAFLILYGTAVAGMFFVWIIILITHLKFRQQISIERLMNLRVKVPCHPFPTLAGIAILVAIAATTFWVRGLEYSIPTFCILLLCTILMYRARNRRRNGISHERDQQ